MRVRTYGERVAAVLIVGAVLVLGLSVAAVPSAEAAPPLCGGNGRIGTVGSVWGECEGNTPGQPPTANQEGIWGAYCGESEQAEAWGWVYQDVPDMREVVFSYVEDLSMDDYVDLNYDPTGVYAWYDIGCITWYDEDAGGPGWNYDDYGVVIFEVTPPIPIEDLLDRARAGVDPPFPTSAAAPPFDNVVVKAPTWLWLDGYQWETLESSDSQGMVTVRIVATPARVEWEMGDSGRVVCDGPGVPWTPGADDADSDCSYTFEDSSAILPAGVFAGSATVVFEVEWWMTDPWRVDEYMGDTGTIERETTFSVDVDEIQAIETNG